jgi:hypothetical protein
MSNPKMKTYIHQSPVSPQRNSHSKPKFNQYIISYVLRARENEEDPPVPCGVLGGGTKEERIPRTSNSAGTTELVARHKIIEGRCSQSPLTSPPSTFSFARQNKMKNDGKTTVKESQQKKRC